MIYIELSQSYQTNNPIRLQQNHDFLITSKIKELKSQQKISLCVIRTFLIQINYLKDIFYLFAMIKLLPAEFLEIFQTYVLAMSVKLSKQNINNQCHLNYMRKSVLLILMMACLSLGQLQSNSKGFIETKSVFLFDTTNGNQADSDGMTYSFNFNRNFTLIPRVGLAVYTMAFEYSPVFSCQVTSDTTTTSATLLISSKNTGRSNQLYIMYLATDHDFLGVFMPGALITYMLNQGVPGQLTQTFTFNFKQQISANSQMNNIRVAVFLTGITSSSELVSNGYPTNHTQFNLAARITSSTNYDIDVTVNSQYGDITISQVQYTIIYFDMTVMENFRYEIDRGDVTLQNFGGTSDSSSKSITMTPLPANANFENLMIFYGISGLECKQGASITLSAYYESYINPQTSNSQILLTMQTWQLTMMLSSTYNFLQYKSLKCGLPGANCDGSCLTSLQPHYTFNGVCNFCQSSCLSCNVSNINTRCDTCDSTRYLNNASGLCICLPGFYQSFNSNVCNNCFPCKTCNLKGVCLSCDRQVNLVLNTILAKCECAPGFYSNLIVSTNTTINNTLNHTTPCLACPENCLYCLNSTFCLACNTLTYLTTNGTCLWICTGNEKYDGTNNDCLFTASSMYDQQGRLGYQWSYTSNESLLSIILTFSQSNLEFYYYENGQGYSMSNSNSLDQQMAETANFYYDDGSYTAGYANAAADNSAMLNIASMESSPANIFGNSQLSNTASSQSSSAVGNLFQQGAIYDSALNGSYYGLGQQQFFKYLYQNYLISNGQTYSYYDIYGIPFGKYNLSTNKAITNPSFADALHKNIALTINNEAVPFTMVALSNNQFQLTASVSRSYYGDAGYLVVKNPGLIRSGSTASQLTNVSQSIYIYDCTIPSYVNAANSIYNSNVIIVEVLWGLGKYPLFIGFGWVFMPLMLALQYIMSLNYIQTTKPLNLDKFLASFADFRNPSIFYNPVRNNIDNSIVSHKGMYMNIQEYNRFDRGIDFMKNCFQFFFVPFLSAILYGIFILVNKILNSFEKDIPFISKYIKPRFFLHVAAYTLVQALPVSFFFFAQLNDTRYSSLNQPNSSYPIFNVAMSYLAFFLTCSIPLMVMTHIYFIYTTKENKVKSAKDFKELFTNLLQSIPQGHHKAGLNDSLWTGDQLKLISYGFGLFIFYLAVLYGFFTSFFIDNYAWQITGLVLITAGLLAFAAVNSHFNSWGIKIFWIVFAALMLAFLFLLAGIGSNASTAPCDQENLGYLGIGFLYALLLAALMASCLILWFTVLEIYHQYFKGKKFVISLKDNKEQIDDKPERIKGFHSTTKLKSTYMKNPLQSQLNMGSRMNIGSMNMGSFNGAGDKYRQMNHDQQMGTEDRMIIKQVNGEEDDVSHNLRQNLLFYQINPRTGEYIFITEGGKRQFIFDENIGRRLKQKQPIYIDNNENIFDRDDQYLGSYEQIKLKSKKTEEPQKAQTKQEDPLFTANQREMIKKDTFNEKQPIIQYTQSKELDDYDPQRRMFKVNEPVVKNVYLINGQEYEKEGEDSNGLFIMRNVQTNQIRKVAASIFTQKKQEILNESMEKQLPKQDSKGSSSLHKKNEVVVSPQIQGNKVVMQKQRKFRFDNQDYIDLGEENGMFKLYNTTKKSLQKIPRQQYINMTLKSFESRINLNGIDYDFDKFGQNNSVHLVEAYSKRPKIVSRDEFNKLKQQNQAAFRLMIGQPSPIKLKQTNEVVTKFGKGGQQQSSALNNLLLVQSKAGKTEVSAYNSNNNYQNTLNYNASNENNLVKHTSTKSVKQVELISYTSNSKKQVPLQQEVLVDEEQQTIEKVLEKSKGPFQLLVVPNDKVHQVDDQDNYDKQDAIQKIILEGKHVKQFMDKTQRKHPNAALFMVDLSNQEEYRLI